MSDTSWLSFQEAVVLVRELRSFSDGRSTATVKRAIASGEVGHSFTEQYIVNEEKQAHQELSESIRRDVAARGFKMSGSALNISHSRAQEGAYERAVVRQRRLITDIGSPDFYEALLPGSIRISRRDLSDWLNRDSPQHNSPPQSNRRYSEDAGLVAEAIEGLTANPPKWPNRHRAAIALQPRAAKGVRAESTIDRLERKIGKALGPKKRVLSGKKNREAS